MTRAKGGVAAALALALAGLPGCAPPSGGPDDTVTVFAAASLSEPFARIGREFEAAHPGVKVTFNFAGSSTLATQINQGAPADVFASAAPANMTTVVDAGNGDGEPTAFARNRLTIAVREGNPKGIRSLADLARPGVRVAVCARQVPCGAAAEQVLAEARVGLTPVTLERDVRAALSKVRLGEVDAALVYRTDVRTVSDVDGVEFPESARAVNEYQIVALRRAPNPAGAAAFVAHVLSDAGAAALADAGFQGR